MTFDARIGSRFGFDEEDLAANGRGEVSAEQERMFAGAAAAMRRREPRVTIMLVVVFAATIAVVAIGIATTPGGADGSALAGAALAAGVIVALIALIAFFRRRGERLVRAMEERRVLTAEGPLNVRTDSTQTWYACIGEARIGVDRYQAEVLVEDAAYRVHYLDGPDGGLPLSLERL